ncbi:MULTISPECIES: MFS transporter [unclassified Nocardia]|uniref:MFS transporter n=1 Tax=unclassified Nocardia TaxID=2637762 RepID=UPI001CE49742|nr:MULTISPECIES: MFS transporter [unclassified Nocardia]
MASAGSRALPLVMALACGIGVANIYFTQAVTPLIAESLGITADSAATVATVTQLGYAVGIFLLVPLGDRLPRRPLIVALLATTGLALLACGLAPDFGPLLAASGVVGVATVVPQLLLPMAAGLVDAERRGSVIGTLQGGLIGGILLARTFGGLLGAQFGWRAPYLVAAVLTLTLGCVLGLALPTTPAATRDRYPKLLADTIRLLRAEPGLRRSVCYQGTLFAGFSAAWTCLALLISGPEYRMGAQVVGLLALIGAASMLCAPAAGRWVDRRGPDRVNLCSIAGIVCAAAVLAFGDLGALTGLIALVIGLLLLDIAIQCSQIANQARIFALRAEIRSRLNTAYMTCSFLGGSAGSWLGIRAFAWSGWLGVCGLLGCTALLTLLTHFQHRRRTAVTPLVTATAR